METSFANRVEEKFAEEIKDAGMNEVQTPAEQFNDPFANSISWAPLVPGGTNSRLHNLSEEVREVLQYKPSPIALGIAVLLPIFGVITGISLIISALGSESNSMDLLIAILLPIVFIAGGVTTWHFLNTPIVFDKGRGYFWKGKLKGFRKPEPSEMKIFCELNSIHALQVISEKCRGNRNSYTSYELNLVLKDASRLNVIDQGNYGTILQDALKLSSFLNVPCWDKAEEE